MVAVNGEHRRRRKRIEVAVVGPAGRVVHLQIDDVIEFRMLEKKLRFLNRGRG